MAEIFLIGGIAVVTLGFILLYRRRQRSKRPPLSLIFVVSPALLRQVSPYPSSLRHAIGLNHRATVSSKSHSMDSLAGSAVTGHAPSRQ